jgi:hypothetical protein
MDQLRPESWLGFMGLFFKKPYNGKHGGRNKNSQVCPELRG